MKNKQNGEYLIISYDDYRDCYYYLDDMDNNPILTHKIIFAASYEICLEYCQERIGYKE
jgi:hypothetical protein